MITFRVKDLDNRIKGIAWCRTFGPGSGLIEARTGSRYTGISGKAISRVQKSTLNSEPLNLYLFMPNEEHNKIRVTTITNELGLHARSAAQIAGIAQNSSANVWIQKDHEKADASSIIDILTLACAKGTKISIIIEDLADLPILNTIADLVDSGFGE